MDLKPVTPRPQPQPTAVVNPVSPTENDPFKADPPIVPPVTTSKAGKGGKGKIILMVILVLLLVGGVGYGVYYWQQQQVSKLQGENTSLSAELTTTKAKVTELEKAQEEAGTEPTTDELVIASVTSYCQAGVDPTSKKALVFTQGTAGAEKKKVLYSADKNFAYVNAACTTAATDKPADFKGYYVKLSGTEWVTLYGAQEADTTLTKTYAIPALADFK